MSLSCHFQSTNTLGVLNHQNTPFGHLTDVIGPHVYIVPIKTKGTVMLLSKLRFQGIISAAGTGPVRDINGEGRRE